MSFGSWLRKGSRAAGGQKWEFPATEGLKGVLVQAGTVGLRDWEQDPESAELPSSVRSCGTLRPVYGGPLAAISLQLAQKRSYQDFKEFRVCLERESSGKRARFLQLVSLSRRLLD